MAEANKQEIILRNHLAWLASTRSNGGAVNTPGSVTNKNVYDNSNITVNTNVKSETDAKVLAAQIEGMNRRVRAGYGTV